ncbi:hypothetical protein FEM48_Zijuj12G0203000 [Ziziphus jujuba var. spinosa]|uniref:INO80 complex subunit B-like conserved region domain-containing protein n=1 Tax=Ziziphus jujuba var. spinosa TaxID=714518 RepID=A0A978UFC4_ZIZJJ|nr:hypothetical protein FEM48_Zijuj12G0203000 [Ziziphus jujuba var. spinosa]
MESFGGSGYDVGSFGVRKKRSNASRRPRLDSHTLLQSYNLLPSSTQPLNNGSHDKNYYKRDTFVVSNGLGSENKLKKLKLKVGGVTHTIHTRSGADFSGGCSSSIQKSSSCDYGFTPNEKSQIQDDTDGNYSFSFDKGKHLGVKWKNISKTDSSSQKEHSLRGKFGENSNESVRKSKRVPKRRILDVGFGEDNDEDDEIQYLGRLGASKVDGDDDGEYRGNQKECRILRVSQKHLMMGGFYNEAVEDYGSSRLGKDSRKKSRSEKVYEEDTDYLEEEEPLSDVEPGSTGKKLRKGSPYPYAERQKETTPTTRKRALQYGRDNLDGYSSSFVELSDCSLPPKSRKKKEKLSELEQQLKKAEAAQRRRMQSEKAAREAEAEAIRKILGQDSGRKKREEKMKKQRDEILQEKNANALTLASNTIRWVNGPTGSVVIFSEDIGLPSIFNTLPCSYPPPREKCAAPNCKNAYKYRDSKSKLPLCSLHCYKAIHEKMQPLVAC